MLSPEEVELSAKKKELSELEALLADRELELATLTAELRSFKSRYFQQVGVLYVELDEINAEAARLLAWRYPDQPQAQVHADAAATRALESRNEAQAADDTAKTDFEPSDELAKIFRQAAIKLHPDLTTDERERERRRRAMADVNRCYENGDAEAIRRIVDEWEHSPDNIDGEGTIAELIRTIRKIAQVRRRVDDLAREVDAVKASDLYSLFQEAESFKSENKDLLSILAADAKEEVEKARRHLETIRKEVESG